MTKGLIRYCLIVVERVYYQRLKMTKILLTIVLVSVHFFTYSQNNIDSCFSTPSTFKAYIENSDSVGITLDHLKKGFKLLVNFAEFKVVKFCVAYIDESNKNPMYYISCHEQPNYHPSRCENFEKNLDGAKKIFIDHIIAERKGKRYCIKQMIYQIRH